MKQYSFSENIEKFINSEDSKDYAENFLESLNVPDILLPKDKITEIQLFKDNEFLKFNSNCDKLEGFIIKSDAKEIFIINHSSDYISFWHSRNFFTWKLAKNHSWKNDSKIRYVVNILPKDKRQHNCIETFDIIKDFYIVNIVDINENLNNWIHAIYAV